MPGAGGHVSWRKDVHDSCSRGVDTLRGIRVVLLSVSSSHLVGVVF